MLKIMVVIGVLCAWIYGRSLCKSAAKGDKSISDQNEAEGIVIELDDHEQAITH